MQLASYFTGGNFRVALGCLALAIFAEASALSQTASPAGAEAMPTDPRALLLKSAESNTLTGENMLPWHMKVSFSLLDDSGSEADKGTIEEFWMSGQKYKVAYQSAKFSQADYGTDSGVMQTGDRNPPPALLALAAAEYTRPVAATLETIVRWRLVKEEKDMGGQKLVCLSVVAISMGDATLPSGGQGYCVDADKPVLRVTQQTPGPVQFVRNDIHTFQGKFVPVRLDAFRVGKKVLTARLEAIETMQTMAESDITPPPDAVAAPVIRQVAISAGVAQSMLLRKVTPEYPAAAKAGGVTGTVVIEARIGKDGHVYDLSVVSGPPPLQKAAMEAVRQWVYKPYLLNGEPVEVKTTINVMFTLSAR